MQLRSLHSAAERRWRSVPHHESSLAGCCATADSVQRERKIIECWGKAFLNFSAGMTPTQLHTFLTCFMAEWCAATDLCCIEARTCLYCWCPSTSLLDNEGEDDEMLFEPGEAEEEEEAACWRIRCSISCSCWRALTKAAFRRLVCSAFRAFFWLDDMQWSQRMVPAFSFLQREVKSVLHWAHVYGSLELELANPAAGPRLPTRSITFIYTRFLYLYILQSAFPLHCKISNLVPINIYPPLPCISRSFCTTSSKPNK